MAFRSVLLKFSGRETERVSVEVVVGGGVMVVEPVKHR